MIQKNTRPRAQPIEYMARPAYKYSVIRIVTRDPGRMDVRNRDPERGHYAFWIDEI
ncbi:unnamed protein product [marine sediment metagenome]|uniref:Uncharacterized protein n=1 Tax=marine sediment metagenome TaxID=412755 RepID=X1DLJ5_9ZZZZ